MLPQKKNHHAASLKVKAIQITTKLEQGEHIINIETQKFPWQLILANQDFFLLCRIKFADRFKKRKYFAYRLLIDILYHNINNVQNMFRLRGGWPSQLAQSSFGVPTSSVLTSFCNTSNHLSMVCRFRWQVSQRNDLSQNGYVYIYVYMGCIGYNKYIYIYIYICGFVFWSIPPVLLSSM